MSDQQSSIHPRSLTDYLSRIGATVLNFRRAMVKIHKGHYYIEKGLIKINADGSITTKKEFEPTEEEAKQIKTDLAGVEFPRTIGARNTDALRRMVSGQIYEFYSRETGEVVFVQERRIGDDGVKHYLPWVFLSNGEWAMMEPDGDLPFWKPRQARMPTGDRIMIHEGAKAAVFADKLAEEGRDHPWIEELSQYEHWGMIGGALAPHRTDYEELRKVKPKEVVYVCDNDDMGRKALQKVSEHWGRSLRGVMFGKSFPPAWDIADDMPRNLFAPSGRYVGPSLFSLTEPATYATELIYTGEKGRPAAVLKPDFSEEWLHCVKPEVYIHRDWPSRIYNAAEFNNMVRPFSHVEETAKLVKKEFSAKASVLKYLPGEVPGVHGGSKDGQYINTYAPSNIKPTAGDIRPWLDFMEHLIPDEADRLELFRWCATLIARPDIRMLYGVLLISETQGIGKGTLGEKILAPLIGEHNVSYPSEQEIVDSAFNYWLAHKRLAVVHEIYAGQSSKAYNKLKSSITDRYVTVQKKYQANYEVENFIHIFACSNSMRAMKLSMDDRRWFVPKLTEDKRPGADWERFVAWLTDEGGLGIIAWWAREFLLENAPVERGAAAPWSALKRQIVEEGYSPGQMIVVRELESLRARIESGELAPDCFVLDLDLIGVIKTELYDGRHNDHLERPATVRSLAKTMGWHIGEVRAQVKAWGPQSIGARVLSRDAGVAETAPGDLGGSQLAPEDRRQPVAIGTNRPM
jgi:hypothetical protein